uniref:Putative mechanosensitive ion channel protein n=1 Tax=uncultured bacterium CSLG7 TaxID=1091577 RepID=G4WV46_9BACT|nr:putative mechanosensitive ion channel protein [uncultured bacterium CSLG7]
MKVLPSWRLLAAAALGLGSMNAQATLVPKPAPPKETPAQDPLNRQSPQSSVVSFLEACRSGNFSRAAKYIDLENIPREQRQSEGPRVAQELQQVLNRDTDFDLADLSKEPEGDLSDGLPGDRERLGSYNLNGKVVDLQLQRKTRRSGVAVWLFSSDSAALAPQLAQVTSDSVIERYLPTVLVNWNLAGTPAWRWIALALIAIAVAALSRSLSRLGIAVLRPVVRMFFPRLESLVEALRGPAQLLLAGALFRASVEWLAPPALLRLYLDRICALLIILGTAWFFSRTADLIIEQVRLRLEARRSTLSRSAMPLASRAVKITICVLALTAVIGSWGYNTSAILAGLGIGGIAIALAAQKTIENLFGGVAVVSDRPVAVGDFCKFGDRVGTVEDIGLRSTRLRTLDRTLVSVPNSEFSSMVLENYSKRDKVLFHTTLNLRRDTKPAQVRSILESIHRILSEDSKVETGTLPVRFIGAGSYSLDIEIFAYIRTADYDEFLQLQQDLLLRIMDAITAAGSALALPTQASIDYSDTHEPATVKELTGNSR